MTNPFAQPSAPGGDNIEMPEHVGALLLINVVEWMPSVTTVNGVANGVRCDIVVLDGPHKGDRYEDAIIWGKVMAMQLRRQVGGKVLGRVAYGQKQPGKNAPFILENATEADMQVGKAYLAGNLTSATPAATAAHDAPPF